MFTVKLLNSIRGRDELEIVLNKTGKEGEEKYERLARLALALKYHEKPLREIIVVFFFVFKINDVMLSLLHILIVNKS